jgi:hypothetical protein
MCRPVCQRTGMAVARNACAKKEKKGQDRRGRDGGNITGAACSKDVYCVPVPKMSERHGSVRVNECMMIKSGALLPTSRLVHQRECSRFWEKSMLFSPLGPLKARGVAITPGLAKRAWGISPLSRRVACIGSGWTGLWGSSWAPRGWGHAEYRRASAAPPWLVATSGMPRQAALLVSNSPDPWTQSAPRTTHFPRTSMGTAICTVYAVEGPS